MRHGWLIACMFALLGFAPIHATDADQSIDDLSWITGTWRGELFGSHAEEHWSTPEGRHMLGVFHMWTNEGPGVYELLEIAEGVDPETGDDRIFLRFKHFNVTTLEPWEKDKPLEFLLTKLDGQRALFTATSEEQRVVTSMEYYRENNKLRIHVKGEHDDGEAFEFTAEFQLREN